MATKGDRLCESLAGPCEYFIGELEGHPPRDRPRCTGVDPDTAVALLERGGLGHADDGLLGGDISDDASATHQAERARHVDYRASFAHPRQNILHAQKHAADIDSHDAIEILLRKFDDWPYRCLNAGIVDEAVDFSPEFKGTGGTTKHLFGVADVGGKRFDDARPETSVAKRDSPASLESTAKTLARSQSTAW
jgi:hypothetical protein